MGGGAEGVHAECSRMILALSQLNAAKKGPAVLAQYKILTCFQSYKDARTLRDHRVLQDKAGSTERLWYHNVSWEQCKPYMMTVKCRELKNHQWLFTLLLLNVIFCKYRILSLLSGGSCRACSHCCC